MTGISNLGEVRKYFRLGKNESFGTYSNIPSMQGIDIGVMNTFFFFFENVLEKQDIYSLLKNVASWTWFLEKWCTLRCFTNMIKWLRIWMLSFICHIIEVLIENIVLEIDVTTL